MKCACDDAGGPHIRGCGTATRLARPADALAQTADPSTSIHARLRAMTKDTHSVCMRMAVRTDVSNYLQRKGRWNYFASCPVVIGELRRAPPAVCCRMCGATNDKKCIRN
jgi:hypothetical protein